jgi:hypothetical protein
LADLADQLARYADELAAQHEKRTDELGAACGLPGYQREVDADTPRARARE